MSIAHVLSPNLGSLSGASFSPAQCGWVQATGSAAVSGMTHNLFAATASWYKPTITQPRNVPSNNTSGTPLTLTRQSGSATNERWERAITDDLYLTLGASIQLTNRYYQSPTWLSFNGLNRISAGLSGRVAALYVDDVLVQTSTIDVVTGKPWFYAELVLDKTALTAELYINGVLACTQTGLNALITTTAIQLDLGQAVYNIQFGEVVLNVGGSTPTGPLQTVLYRKSGNNTLGWSGSDVVNTFPFASGTYRNSATSGANDLYTYTNTFPSAFNYTSIAAVGLSIVASSDGATAATMSARLRLSSTNYDTSLSAQLPNTSPVLTQTFYATNPNTVTAWTAANIAAAITGYVVAP